MCSSSPTSKMNSTFIPSKPTALFLYSFLNAWNSSASVISVFRVWLSGNTITWAKWSVRNCMGGRDWPTSPQKPSKSVATLILSTMSALGRYFFQNESASTFPNTHICWAFTVSQRIIFLFRKCLSLFSWCLVACESGLAFNQSFNSHFVVQQSSVKRRFMVVSLSIAPSRRLVAKNKLCCSTHALL